MLVIDYQSPLLFKPFEKTERALQFFFFGGGMGIILVTYRIYMDSAAITAFHMVTSITITEIK